MQELSKLLKEHTSFDLEKSLIYLGYRGSISHGTNLKDKDSIDDIDYFGINMSPLNIKFGLTDFEQFEKKEDKYDILIYEIKKFFHLLIKSNPNVITTLWMPNEFILHSSWQYEMIRAKRSLFASKNLYSAFCGYSHAQLYKMEHLACNGYMGQKRKILVEKFGYDCYSEDTEFLTNLGWKKYDEITDVHKLATINGQHCIMFQNYTNRVKHQYAGDMYDFESRYTSMLVSPDHRMYVSPASRNLKNKFSRKYNSIKSKWQFTSAKNLIENKKSGFHMLTGISPSNKNLGKSIEYLELMGAFVSEGTFAKFNKKTGKFRCIRISQTLQGKKEFFDLMSRIENQFKFKKYTYKHKNRDVTETVWCSHLHNIVETLYNECGHKSKNKSLPPWIINLSKIEADALLNALILGDGTKVNGYSNVYYTSSYKLASDVQTLALIAGRDSQIYGPYKSTGYKDILMYQVYIRNGPSLPKYMCFSNKINKQRIKNEKVYVALTGGKKVHYEGNIVCFTVPNSILVTRRKGKIAIQGNCKNAQHLIRLLRQGIEFLKTGNFIVNRKYVDADELIAIKTGQWSLEKIKNEAERLFKEMEKAKDESKLPEVPNFRGANNLLVDICQLTY